MSIFKEVKCFFYSKESNGGIRGKDFECTVVCQSGSSTFVIYEMGLQFQVDEKVLGKVILDNKTIETDGIYISFTDENILPVKCKIKIDVMERETNFSILNKNSFVGIKNKYLKKVLNIS